MTTDGWYEGEVMDYKVETVESADPGVLALTLRVRLHPQQKDVRLRMPPPSHDVRHHAPQPGREITMTNPTPPSDIYDTFMNHRAAIIGAARRAPQGTRVWAVVNLDGTWDGIYAPLQRGSWPVRVRDGACYHLSFGAEPFLSHDTFNDALSDHLIAWQDVYIDTTQGLRAEPDV
jgi:hypothetical protein